MKPTLKSVLIRVLKIAASVVASIVAFTFIMTLVNKIRYPGTTLWGVLLFVVTLTIILVNMRRVIQPIKLSAVALYIAAVAAIIMWHKLEYTWWGPYRRMLIIPSLIAVPLSAFMPLLRGVKAERFARAGKISLLAAVLMINFAAAFPNVSFTEYDSEGMYMGIINVEASPDSPRGKRLRTFGYAGQRWYGFNDIEDIQVLTPVDAEGRMYESRTYRHAWDSDYMVDTLTRDTIWLHGMWSKPGHRSMENIELAALRHQWQYDMWHRLKQFFNKDNY